MLDMKVTGFTHLALWCGDSTSVTTPLQQVTNVVWVYLNIRLFPKKLKSEDPLPNSHKVETPPPPGGIHHVAHRGGIGHSQAVADDLTGGRPVEDLPW